MKLPTYDIDYDTFIPAFQYLTLLEEIAKEDLPRAITPLYKQFNSTDHRYVLAVPCDEFFP